MSFQSHNSWISSSFGRFSIVGVCPVKRWLICITQAMAFYFCILSLIDWASSLLDGEYPRHALQRSLLGPSPLRFSFKGVLVGKFPFDHVVWGSQLSIVWLHTKAGCASLVRIHALSLNWAGRRKLRKYRHATIILHITWQNGTWSKHIILDIS